jgi:hypothetical protein
MQSRSLTAFERLDLVPAGTLTMVVSVHVPVQLPLGLDPAGVVLALKTWARLPFVSLFVHTTHTEVASLVRDWASSQLVKYAQCSG